MLFVASSALAQPATATKVPSAQARPATKGAVTEAAAARPLDRTRITQGIVSAKIESVAPNRGVLTIATESGADGRMRLLDASLQEVAVSRETDGTLKADVDPGKGYIYSPRETERKPLTKEGVHLPARYLTFTAAGATNLGGLFLRPAVVPLTWNDRLKAYATELFVGYEFADGREVNLPVPRTVTFFAEGANARIEADAVTVRKSGGSGYQRVVLSTGQIEGETHFTARVSAADELKSSVTVLREAGGLKLALGSNELPAFGVGSDVLTVSVIGRDGVPFATPKPLEIQLTSRGVRQPSLVVVEPGQSSTRVDVRTTGYGPGEIVAQSGNFRAELPIRLVFPTAALGGATLGGCLGGVTRYLRNRRKGRALLPRRILEGLLVGLIVVGAVWAGLVAVDVSTGILGTPFGAFVLGALSGYLGCVVLDQVARKTFGGLKAG